MNHSMAPTGRSEPTWTFEPPARPARSELRGAHVLLRPLDADGDAEALYAESHPPLGDPGLWTYLPNGPYRDPAELRDALRIARPRRIRCSSRWRRCPRSGPPASPRTCGSRQSTA